MPELFQVPRKPITDEAKLQLKSILNIICIITRVFITNKITVGFAVCVCVCWRERGGGRPYTLVIMILFLVLKQSVPISGNVYQGHVPDIDHRRNRLSPKPVGPRT